MSPALQIEVKNEALHADIVRLVGGLRSRKGLHHAMAARARVATVNHLIDIARTRHKTAEALGASPTGFWAQAAEQTRAEATNDSAAVAIKHPGIGRAFRDVEIKAKPPRKFLALPVIGEAYGRRAYRVRGLVAVVTGDRGVLMMPQKGRSRTYRTRRYSGTVWYVLKRSVKLKQDRTLLPSDEEYRLAALEGVRDYVDYLIARGGRA